MNPIVIALISVVILLGLIVMRTPIAIALGLSALAGFFMMGRINEALSHLATLPFWTVANFGFAVIPMFIFMGYVAFYSGIGEDLFKVASKWLGAFRGGLAMATVAGCAAFGAACGSSIATSALFTKLAVPEMIRYN